MNVIRMPQAANEKLTGKSFIDYQNDVKVTDVSLAIREGFEASSTPKGTPHWGWLQIKENFLTLMALTSWQKT